MNNTGLYFKVGAAYRRAEISSSLQGTLHSSGTTTDLSSYVRPMFATGLDCAFTNAWYGVIQYAFFMGANNSFPLTTANTGAMRTVAANVLTLGLGYKFTV